MKQVVLLLAAAFFCCSSLHAQETLEAQRARADAVLQQPSTVSRPEIGVVFDFADRLRREGKKDEALRYYVSGLKTQPWALEEQLTAAELMADADPAQAKQKRELVARHAERDGFVIRARQALGQPVDASVPQLAKAAGDAPAIVLAPLEGADPLLVKELAPLLQQEAGIPVLVQQVKMELPPGSNRLRERQIGGMRQSVLQSNDPGLDPALKQMGMTRADLQDDAKFLRFMRATIANSPDPQRRAAANRTLDSVERQQPQLDTGEVIGRLREATREAGRPGVAYLAVTRHDLYTQNANFLFGSAAGNHGVLSYHRFLAEFNGEPPNRERLVQRTLKQALSSGGFVLGIDRCTDPTCARAYPNSLPEHDAKSAKLCPVCKAGFERVAAAGPPK